MQPLRLWSIIIFDINPSLLDPKYGATVAVFTPAVSQDC